MKRPYKMKKKQRERIEMFCGFAIFGSGQKETYTLKQLKIILRGLLCFLGKCLVNQMYAEQCIAETFSFIKALPEWRGYQQHMYIRDIEAERQRQNELHPHIKELSEPDWFLVIFEEIGEMVQSFNNGDYDNTKTEAIQVASVLIRYWEVKAKNNGS